jgi:hypothetical protein
MSEQGEDYFVPLEDQRVFGAGIKRKRIAFIPASSEETVLSTSTPEPSTTLGARYLSIVLAKDRTQTSSPASQQDTTSTTTTPKTDLPTEQICPICGLPISQSAHDHESSLPHQVATPHVHPPSHLPREHIGVRYLASHGWDPDSRLGLGARRSGISVPIKAKEKKDTAGLREQEDEDEKSSVKKTLRKMPTKQEKIVKLNAREVVKQEKEARVRAEKLRKSFYGEDLTKYLGPNG